MIFWAILGIFVHILSSKRVDGSITSGQAIIQFTQINNLGVVIKRPRSREDFDREVSTLTKLKTCPKVLQPIFVIPELREIGFKEIVGGDLYHCQNLTALPIEQLKEYVRQLVKTVECVHQAGLIHLDIKPENILIDGTKIWLIDFGLACSREEPVRGIGTTRTMAPETLLQEASDVPITTAADWWSVGVTIFYIFSRHYQADPQCHIANFPYEVSGNPLQIDWPLECNEFPADLQDLLFGVSGLMALDYQNRLPNAEKILAHPFLKDSSFSSS